MGAVSPALTVVVAKRGTVGRPSPRPGLLGEKAPVGVSFDTLRSDLNPGF